MNSDEAERRVRAWLAAGDPQDPELEPIKALLEFHEQNKALIADLERQLDEWVKL